MIIFMSCSLLHLTVLYYVLSYQSRTNLLSTYEGGATLPYFLCKNDYYVPIICLGNANGKVGPWALYEESPGTEVLGQTGNSELPCRFAVHHLLCAFSSLGVSFEGTASLIWQFCSFAAKGERQLPLSSDLTQPLFPSFVLSLIPQEAVSAFWT